MTVTITLACAIKYDLLAKLQSKILEELDLDSKATFVIEYDPNLVLGYSLTIGSQVYDKSFAAAIKGKLATIQAKIQ